VDESLQQHKRKRRKKTAEKLWTFGLDFCDQNGHCGQRRTWHGPAAAPAKVTKPISLMPINSRGKQGRIWWTTRQCQIVYTKDSPGESQDPLQLSVGRSP
jgi:hypothetical protein